MHRFVTKMQAAIPLKLRRTLLGTTDSPSRLAHAVHSILNWLPFDRFPTLPCQGFLDGYRMKIDWQRYRSYVYGTWEPEVVSCLQRNVPPGALVLDIGAHIGFYALLLSKLVGGNGMVYSFEPVPGNYDLLSENIKLNNCRNVRLIRKAVLANAGVIRVTVPGIEPTPGSVSLNTDYGTAPITVEATTLDGFAVDLQSRIHLIKMDVEGAEHEVLLGGERTIRRQRPDLMIELHHFHSAPEDHTTLQLLREWNYDVTWLNRMPETSHVFAQPRETSLDPKG
jgi:FkbM family methyltransferase